ncbi:hypothetical protein RQP46_007764 [Phenoliferia psychrophenolica]
MRLFIMLSTGVVSFTAIFTAILVPIVEWYLKSYPSDTSTPSEPNISSDVLVYLRPFNAANFVAFGGASFYTSLT